MPGERCTALVMSIDVAGAQLRFPVWKKTVSDRASQLTLKRSAHCDSMLQYIDGVVGEGGFIAPGWLVESPGNPVLGTWTAGVVGRGVGAAVTLGEPRCADSKTRIAEIHLISSSSEGAHTMYVRLGVIILKLFCTAFFWCENCTDSEASLAALLSGTSIASSTLSRLMQR